MAEYASGIELCSDMEQIKEYTLICLDISMEQLDGLQTAGRIKGIYPEIPVVLITEFISYALEGYRVKADRFLVKDELATTLWECLDEILLELAKKKQRVFFPFVEGDIRLEVQKIIYVETQRHKNIFHTANERYSLYRKLDAIEAELAPFGFVRIHQSFLVNMQYIEKISGYVLRLTTGKKISVPKARYAYVKREYAIYKGA